MDTITNYTSPDCLAGIEDMNAWLAAAHQYITDRYVDGTWKRGAHCHHLHNLTVYARRIIMAQQKQNYLHQQSIMMREKGMIVGDRVKQTVVGSHLLFGGFLKTFRGEIINSRGKLRVKLDEPWNGKKTVDFSSRWIAEDI